MSINNRIDDIVFLRKDKYLLEAQRLYSVMSDSSIKVMAAEMIDIIELYERAFANLQQDFEDLYYTNQSMIKYFYKGKL